MVCITFNAIVFKIAGLHRVSYTDHKYLDTEAVELDTTEENAW